MVQANELIRLLYGEEAEEEMRPDERLRRWVKAFDDWLEYRRTQFSRNIGPASHKTWVEFLAFTRKAPWDIGVEDVEAYLEALEGKGLRAGTIQKRLTGLKKFYTFCQEKGIDPQCEAGFNPAAKARKPIVKGYEKANYLSMEEEKALLAVIKSDPSVIGKRDYALFSLLLRTGCRAGEARGLRWGDVAPQIPQDHFDLALDRPGAGPRDTGAGSSPSRTLCGTGFSARDATTLRSAQDEGGGRRVELPGEVWEAMRIYLEAAGRWGTIRPEEYVFAPSKEALVREAGGKADDWAAERPLSMDQLHYLVKLYAGWAGLRAEEITCHTLRHTAVMRWVEAGMGVEEVQKRLGRVNAGKTREYIERLKNTPRRTRKKAEAGLRVRDRGPCRTKPRNHLALKHGLRAKYLPELEWLEEQGIQLKGFDRGKVRLRVVMMRALILSEEAKTLKEGLTLLEVVGTAGMRLRKLAILRHELREARMKAEREQAVEEAIEEVLKEEWPKWIGN